MHGFRKFAKLAKAAVLLLVLKGIADGLVRSLGFLIRSYSLDAAGQPAIRARPFRATLTVTLVFLSTLFLTLFFCIWAGCDATDALVQR